MDWFNIIEALFLAGAVYGGIRADLKAMHEKITVADKSATRAHERIDAHLERGH